MKENHRLEAATMVNTVENALAVNQDAALMPENQRFNIVKMVNGSAKTMNAEQNVREKQKAYSKKDNNQLAGQKANHLLDTAQMACIVESAQEIDQVAVLAAVKRKSSHAKEENGKDRVMNAEKSALLVPEDFSTKATHQAKTMMAQILVVELANVR